MVLRSSYYEFIPSEQRNAHKGTGVKNMKKQVLKHEKANDKFTLSMCRIVQYDSEVNAAFRMHLLDLNGKRIGSIYMMHDDEQAFYPL